METEVVEKHATKLTKQLNLSVADVLDGNELLKDNISVILSNSDAEPYLSDKSQYFIISETFTCDNTVDDRELYSKTFQHYSNKIRERLTKEIRVYSAQKGVYRVLVICDTSVFTDARPDSIRMNALGHLDDYEKFVENKLQDQRRGQTAKKPKNSDYANINELTAVEDTGTKINFTVEGFLGWDYVLESAPYQVPTVKARGSDVEIIYEDLKLKTDVFGYVNSKLFRGATIKSLHIYPIPCMADFVLEDGSKYRVAMRTIGFEHLKDQKKVIA